MAAGEPGLDLVPVLDPILALLPAPEHIAAVQLAVEIDQALLKSLEHATDSLELGQIVRNTARDVLDARAQSELIGGLAPLGTSLSGGEFIPIDQLSPFGIQRSDVSNYATD